jgi:hypothetical protein
LGTWLLTFHLWGTSDEARPARLLPVGIYRAGECGSLFPGLWLPDRNAAETY